MPLLFLGLSLLAFAAMAAAGATSKTPQLGGPSRTVTMNPGEIWSVSGMRNDSPTPAMWDQFHTKLAAIMGQMGAEIGKLDYSGSSFSFQIHPTSQVMTIQVPMVDAMFAISNAERLQAAPPAIAGPSSVLSRALRQGAAMSRRRVENPEERARRVLRALASGRHA